MEHRILLLNYYWPPSGGSAVQRWLHFVKNLAEIGIATDVITIDPAKATFQNIDKTLEEDIPTSTRIFRTDTAELFNLYRKYLGKGSIPKLNDETKSDNRTIEKLGRFVRGNIFLPDPRKGWNRFALKQARILIKENNYAAIITAGPPHSTHLVGLQLKKEKPKTKWIADFHDYWTEIYNLKSFFYRTQPAHYFDLRLERKVVTQADYVMTHCQSSFDDLIRKVPEAKNKIKIFTIGYDEMKIATAKADALPPAQERNQFTIAYTGIITALYQPEFLLQAVSEVIEEKPEKNVQLIFAGTIYEKLIADIESYGLQDHFQYLGYLPHAKVLSLLLSADLLLLLNPRVSGDQQIIPGKLFEYLGIGKPILSISSHGSENEQIISKAGAGKNFEWEEVPKIKQFILSIMGHPHQYTRLNTKYIQENGRMEQSKRLASIILS